ncbi:hypothetical protein [Leptospira santarosai]|uniref:hypothetical protein n=1 Tax=Leptospira santarosai TaxID=28183 RepID=UPI001E3B5EF6|nr:hypothetical protein [Leptospira santarosai]
MNFPIEKIIIETTSPDIFLKEEGQIVKFLRTENVTYDLVDEGLAFGEEDYFVLVTSLIIFIKESVYSGIVYDLIKLKIMEIYEKITPQNRENTFIDAEFYENGALKRIQLANSLNGVIKIRNHKGKWIKIKMKNDYK